MRALYWKAPTAGELAVAGLKAKHYPEPVVGVWPWNWPALQLYSRYQTQWRTGPNGPIGLDYGVIQHELGRIRVSDDEYSDYMHCIRVIESAALDEMHKE